MKKILWVIGIVVFVAALALAIRIIFGGSEDTWICGENGWTKHGSLSAPMPTTFCENQNNTWTISRNGKLSDLVVIESPKVGDRLSSPIKITGKAPGNWFFEATAPVFVVDWDGRIVGQSYVTAEGEWMTTDLVNFSGEVEYVIPKDIYSKRGALILKRDNPSDLPQNDAALEVPIYLE